MNAQGRHLVCHDHIATAFQRFSNVRCLLGIFGQGNGYFLLFPFSYTFPSFLIEDVLPVT